jgi:hypothetical protein
MATFEACRVALSTYRCRHLLLRNQQFCCLVQWRLTSRHCGISEHSRCISRFSGGVICVDLQVLFADFWDTLHLKWWKIHDFHGDVSLWCLRRRNLMRVMHNLWYQRKRPFSRAPHGTGSRTWACPYTVVSVKTAPPPIRFVTGTERPRLKKPNTVTATIPSVLAGCKIEIPNPFANRLSEMLLAVQWALFINMTVPVVPLV